MKLFKGDVNSILPLSSVEVLTDGRKDTFFAANGKPSVVLITIPTVYVPGITLI